MTRILIINGPNLNMLGQREKQIYGEENLDEIIRRIRAEYRSVEILAMQSNEEGAIVTAIQEAKGNVIGIVINAGGYSHTSVAIRDAIAAVEVPVVEVHLSNLLAREPFRHVSIIGGVCAGSIMGFGAPVYSLAVRYLIDRAAGRRNDPTG